ncbi:MAG: hypothetical protein ACFFCS_23220 [Candidatus Hodarchaeota archaeon]
MIIPLVLFSTIGFFAWAVRGMRGYGSIPGATFAGICYAIVWLFLSRNSPNGSKEGMHRPYNLGWAVLGIAAGIGVNGMRGWMSFYRWRLGLFSLDAQWDEASNIGFPPGMNLVYSLSYWFLIGATWAGTGAVFLAWSGAKKKYIPRDWILRIVLGAAGAGVAYLLWLLFPQIFLPNYQTGYYADLNTCYECRETMGDTRIALILFGAYAGFFLFEIIKKDWRNVKLILIVSVVTGFSWMLFQWMKIPEITGRWKYFEGLAGVGIGIGLGLAYFACNKPVEIQERSERTTLNVEKIIGVEFALILGLGWSMTNGITQVIENYMNKEPYLFLPVLFIPVLGLVLFIWSIIKTRSNPFKPGDGRDNLKQYNSLFAISYAMVKSIGFILTSTEFLLEEKFSYSAVLMYSILLLIYVLSTNLEVFLLFFIIHQKSKRFD